MGLGRFIAKQFVDVLQWTESGPGVLAHRYPMQDMEIQNGAALTVRETQKALFVDQGKVADIFDPGQHTLTTRTLPVLTYLKNWDKFFESPFKSDVYFFSTREQLDQKWGTAQPITVRDPEFGGLRLRANGVYSYRLTDIGTFWSKLSGTVPTYTVQDASGQLRAAIVTAMASAVGSSGVPFLDMAASQGALSETLRTAVAPVFADFGLTLTSFYLQSLSLPEEVQQHLDRASSRRIVGDLHQYARFEAADSLQTAAANPGGLAGGAVGMGAGLAMGRLMGDALGSQTPPPSGDPIATIERLGDLLKKGLITQTDFDAKKAELLREIR